jgi:DNA-3-methyladenine glycosylase II
MFLIFHLQRPDVLPLGDLGLQRAVSLHYNRGRKVTEARMQRIAQPWAPWRSVATWYLWRSLDGEG